MQKPMQVVELIKKTVWKRKRSGVYSSSIELRQSKFQIIKNFADQTWKNEEFQAIIKFYQMFFSEQTYQNLNSTDFQIGEYEVCTFVSCNLSNLNFAGSSFENCTFRNCDLSNAKVSSVSFRQVKFETCKILGVHFNASNPFLLEFNFQSCQLDYCNFFNLKLKKSIFKNCRMLEVDFSQADLTGSDFQGSDLLGVVFDRTNLEKSDFREAVNFRIDPETNRIKGAKFDLEGLPGLLGKWGIKIG